jgi:Cu/Ag efflux protein CusF
VPFYLLAFVAAGALCACSAPSIPLSAGPADATAATTPFTRPVNALAVAGTPASESMSSPPDMSAPMPGMDMSGGGMSGMDHGSMELRPMPGMEMAHATPAEVGIQAVGKVNSVDAANRTVNLTHQPIRNLGWPSMTMDFKVAPSVDLGALKPGEAVTFTLGAPDADGNRLVERLLPR